MIVDTFAGIGWSEGLRTIGLADIGIELDPAACATRAANGHLTIRASVTSYPLDRFRGVTGFIASPPCQTFSSAGKGAGRFAMSQVAELIRDAAHDRPTFAHHRRRIAHALRSDELGRSGTRRSDASVRAWRSAHGAALTAQPMRWIVALRPEWVAMEQVPEVLPLWKVYAHELRRLGYSAWCGILNAADFGVPQTRRRAFLMASRVKTVHPPDPTHARNPEPTLFGSAERWVSMAEALGWDQAVSVHHAEASWMVDRHGLRPDRAASEVSPTLTSKARCWTVNTKLRAGGPSQYVATERRISEPGPTLAFGHDAANWTWEIDGQSVRMSIEDAKILQGFRPDVILAGSRSAQFLQIGNSVPPPMASVVVRHLAS